MFKTIILSSIAISTLHAQAYTLKCESLSKKMGAPYYVAKVNVELPGVGSLAALKIPGEKSPRKMQCVSPVINFGSKGADRMYTLALCNDGIDAGGYSMRITSGGIMGGKRATVFAKGKKGSKVLTYLSCRSSGK